VFAIGVQLNEMCFLPGRQFWLLPAQPALGLGYPHPFPRACADEVTFKLSDHGQDIKQQLADRVGGIMNRTADAELYSACGQIIGDLVSIPDGAGEPVQLGYDEGVAFSARCQRFAKAWAVRVAAGQAVVDIDP
jgi:hypothetical protein